MAGIQLIGKDSVIDAFEKFDADTWALFQGKQLLVSGQGGDLLEQWLDSFMPAGSTGQYTLRIYDTGLPVKQGTDYIAALNFKLHDAYNGAGIHGYGTKMEQRLAALEKEREQGDDDEDDIGSILIGWLKDPDKLETGIGAIKQIFSAAGQPAPVNTGQTMAGITQATGLSDSDEKKLERLAAVLDRLEKRDPKIIEHLEKLAGLNDMMFNMAISTIEKL